MKILIACANYNRKKVAQTCFYQTFRTIFDKDRMIIYDDCSDEYKPEEVFKDRCHELAVSKENLGIHKQRGHQIREFVEVYQDYDALYFTDSDAYHDPGWRQRLEVLSKTGFPIIGLYDSPCHQENTIDNENPDYFVRRYCPGISMLITREVAKKVNESPLCLEMPSWDYNVSEISQAPTIISRISYVEHFGAGGLHSDDFERDRAINPTRTLRKKRGDVLRKICS